MVNDNDKVYKPKLTTKQATAVRLALAGKRKQLVSCFYDQQKLIALVREKGEGEHKKWATGMLKHHYEVLGYLAWAMDLTHPDKDKLQR